jgi:hypothetical protein
MLADDDQLWRLLRSLDDPDNLESPADRRHDSPQNFDALRGRLEGDFKCVCREFRGVQDASFEGDITIPEGVTATGRALGIRLSNFGGLAVITAHDVPTGWTDWDLADRVHPDDRVRIDAALSDLGYTLVPLQPLRRPYDGVLGPDPFVRGTTWWIRFFDWL